MLFLLLSILIGGLIIGGLGRLVVPGPNPMGLLATAGIGVLGALIGWAISRALFVNPADHELVTVLLEIAAAAVIVAAISRRHRLR